MPSIKKNFLYSSILTASNYIFPFITYPYVSRVLGVTNIGICNFTDSIVNYFILFSMMGIGIIGIREISKVKNNKKKLNQTFSELLFLNTITTLIALTILLIAIFTVPKLYEHKNMMFIGVIKLITNYLLIEWFYKGLEEFKYITARTIIVKTIYVFSVFLFVRKANDYNIYYLLTTLMIGINSILNCIHSRKYISLSWKNIKISPYIKSFLILGTYTFLTSMYTSFNVAYLGFTSGEKEVGYYTTATKIYSILLALFTAFTGVMLPRMSSLLNENKTEEFNKLIKKSIEALITFSFPLIIITIVFAPQIIRVIAGKGYEGAIIPMRIVMPLILVIGYEQILIIQTLMPMQKDKAIFINSIRGAITGIILNILLVSTYKSTGSAIVWIFSELVVLISAQHFVNQYTTLRFPYKKVIKNIIWAIPPIIISIIIYDLTNLCYTLKIISGGSIVVLYYYIIEVYINKNELVVSILLKIKEVNSKLCKHQ